MKIISALEAPLVLALKKALANTAPVTAVLLSDVLNTPTRQQVVLPASVAGDTVNVDFSSFVPVSECFADNFGTLAICQGPTEIAKYLIIVDNDGKDGKVKIVLDRNPGLFK